MPQRQLPSPTVRPGLSIDFGRLPVEERVLLDYVFVTKGAKIDRYRVIQDKPENSYLSDHCPILVELTVQ